jgi:NodT family efflux transporter outer membrane factor (OMF) lipoprotein
MAPSTRIVSGSVLAGLVVVAGCDFAPRYARPEAAIPGAFKEQPRADEGWKAAEPRDRQVRGKWWKLFGDPELDELEDQAGLSNQNIAAALAHFQAARAVVKQSQSEYYPTVGATPSVTESRQVSAAAPGARATPYTITQFSLTFDASWEVDFWGRIRNSVKASSYEAQATLADLENVRLAVQAEMAADYFQIRVLDAQRELLDSTVSDLQESLNLVQIQADTGMASGQDVEQATTLLQVTSAQATDLGIQRAVLEHAAATLIGKPASSFSLAARPVAAPAVAVPFGLPSELLERRPDIAAAERRVAEANAQIGVARAAYFPTTVLSGGVGFQGSVLSGVVAGPNLLWSVGASLAATLFDGGRRRAVTEQARANYLGTVANYRQTVLGAFQDVEDNLSTLRILSVELGQQADAVESSRRLLAIALSRYQSGLDIYLDVITAQTGLLVNQRTALNLRMQQMLSSVLLVKALGGGWETAPEPAGAGP